MYLVFRKTYSPKAKAGMIAEVDKIKRSKCSSGFMVRVTNIWKTPKYLDLGWFL